MRQLVAGFGVRGDKVASRARLSEMCKESVQKHAKKERLLKKMESYLPGSKDFIAAQNRYTRLVLYLSTFDAEVADLLALYMGENVKVISQNEQHAGRAGRAGAGVGRELGSAAPPRAGEDSLLHTEDLPEEGREAPVQFMLRPVERKDRRDGQQEDGEEACTTGRD